MVKAHAKRSVVLALADAGMSTSEIVKKLKMNRMTVHNTIKRGTDKDRPRSGRPKLVTTPEKIKLVKKCIARKGKRSMRQIARELNMSDHSMRVICREKLGNKSYKFRERHGLSDKQVEGRLKKVPLLLARAANGAHLRTVFTDEKTFTVERTFNRQNDRVLAPTSQAADDTGRTIERNSHPKSVMVFAAITGDGKCPLHFVWKEAKVNTEVYISEILEACVLPWAKAHFGRRKWIYQQDGAPAHTAKKMQQWLTSNVPEFIPKAEWPANSPDLNPLDYSVWALLEGMVNVKSYMSIDALKAALSKAWDAIPLEKVRAIVDNYPKRLQRIMKAKGGHIE